MVIKRSPGGQACRWRAINFEIHLWSSGKNADCIFGDRSASSMSKWRPAWTLTPEMIHFRTKSVTLSMLIDLLIIIGSAEALPILCVRYFWWERERERERDTERERRKWRHHCRAKIGDEFTLSLAKNSHNWRWAYTFPCQKFALFDSPFTLPLSPFTMVALKFAMSSHFPLPKKISPSGFVPPLSNDTSRATSDRKPKTNDQILPSPILFFPSKNWIKLIPKTIGNRKRDCAWGGSGW